MKLLKSFLILFIAISITSCSSSDDENSFELVATNLVGEYTLTAYESVETETATSSTGTETILSTTTKTRSSSTVVVILNANNTYSIDGILVMDSKTDQDENDDEIKDLDDTSGTYTLNIVSKTITLTPTTDESFIDGSFNIKTFKEDQIVLEQEVEGSGDVSISTTTDITLERN
jgi:hypothetical protein